jgi:hypothetical protein
MNHLLKWDKGYEEAMVVATTLNNPNRADELYIDSSQRLCFTLLIG